MLIKRARKTGAFFTFRSLQIYFFMIQLKMPNKFNMKKTCIAQRGKLYSFSSRFQPYEFSKNANSVRLRCEGFFLVFFLNLFGDNWSLRFSVR